MLTIEELSKIRDLYNQKRSDPNSSVDDYYNTTSDFKALGLQMPTMYDDLQPEIPYVYISFNETTNSYNIKNRQVNLNFDKFEELFFTLSERFKDHIVEIDYAQSQNSEDRIDMRALQIPMGAMAGRHSLTQEVMVIDASSNSYRLDYYKYLVSVITYLDYIDISHKEIKDAGDWVYARSLVEQNPLHWYFSEHRRRRSPRTRNGRVNIAKDYILYEGKSSRDSDYIFNSFTSHAFYDREKDQWGVISYFNKERNRIFKREEMNKDQINLLDSHIEYADTVEEAYIKYADWLIANYAYNGEKKEDI